MEERSKRDTRLRCAQGNGMGADTVESEGLWEAMNSPDSNQAYVAFKRLGALASEAPMLDAYKNDLVDMLDAKSSYARTRAFLLLATNMRWIEDEPEADGLFEKMASCLHDPKPTVVRQCIQAMPQLVATSPGLARRIVRELEEIDPSGYRDSMAPLIAKDVATSLAEIRETGLVSLDGDRLTARTGRDHTSLSMEGGTPRTDAKR